MGADLSGCHRSQDGTRAHPAQSGRDEEGRMIQGCDPALELMSLVKESHPGCEAFVVTVPQSAGQLILTSHPAASLYSSEIPV